MTNAQNMSSQKHDTSVPYADEVVPGEGIDVQRWESWAYADADGQHYFAKGPCPACFAVAQGHAGGGPLEGQGAGEQDANSEKLAGGIEIEIPVRCQCGFGHGRQDARGCGRSWSVVVMRTRP